MPTDRTKFILELKPETHIYIYIYILFCLTALPIPLFYGRCHTKKLHSGRRKNIVL